MMKAIIVYFLWTMFVIFIGFKFGADGIAIAIVSYLLGSVFTIITQTK